MICDTSFAQKSQLKVHIAGVHEGNRPFKCDMYGDRFTQKSNLKKHMRKIHLTVSDYKTAQSTH